FKINYVSNSNRVCAFNSLNAEFTFDTTRIKHSVFCFYGVPTSSGFIYDSCHLLYQSLYKQKNPFALKQMGLLLINSEFLSLKRNNRNVRFVVFFLLKLNYSVNFSVQCVVFTDVNIFPSIVLCTSLSNDDVPCNSSLTTENLNS